MSDTPGLMMADFSLTCTEGRDGTIVILIDGHEPNRVLVNFRLITNSWMGTETDSAQKRKLDNQLLALAVEWARKQKDPSFQKPLYANRINWISRHREAHRRLMEVVHAA